MLCVRDYHHVCPEAQAGPRKCLPNSINTESWLQARSGVRGEEWVHRQSCTVPVLQEHLSVVPKLLLLGVWAWIPLSPALRPSHRQTAHLGFLLWLQFPLKHRPSGFWPWVLLSHDLVGPSPAHSGEVTS